MRRRLPKGFVAPADKLLPGLYEAAKPLLRDDFFTLNIGANNGVDNDPIHPFLMMYPGWTGLAVEPEEANFRELCANIARFPGITPVRAAIARQDRPLYRVADESGCDMAWVSQICSFDRDYVARSLAGMRLMAPAGTVTDDAEAHIVADRDAPCLPLAALLSRYRVERVDFLNIDAEGEDFRIFEDFDLERYRPAIVCVETACFSAAQKSAFDARMGACGYRFHDTFELFSEIHLRG